MADFFLRISYADHSAPIEFPMRVPLGRNPLEVMWADALTAASWPGSRFVEVIVPSSPLKRLIGYDPKPVYEKELANV
jgi:hypothetical protein